MINFLYSLQDLITDTSEWVKYDLLGTPLPKAPEVPSKLRIILHKEKSGYWVTSPDYPAFLASGKTLEELREAMFDTLLVYFNVPRPVARKLPDNFVLTLPDGTMIKPKGPFLKPVEVKITFAS